MRSSGNYSQSNVQIPPQSEIRVSAGYGLQSEDLGVDKSVADGPRRVVSFQHFLMGQYFKAANLDKREFVCPWCINGGAKLWEWAANPQGAIFTLLLRQSDAVGGGDVNQEPILIELDSDGRSETGQTLSEIIAEGFGREGALLKLPPESVVGRWAGDRVVLIGDYDSSGLYGEVDKFTNISEAVVRDWNQFIGDPERKLSFHPDCCSPGW